MRNVGGGFEVGVGIGFFGEDGDGPAVLGGDDGFEIPIRSFDEPDPDGRAAIGGPIGQILQIVQRAAEIGLNGDADVGPVAEFIFESERI